MDKIYKNNVKAIKKYYDNATKEQVIEDMFLDICDLQQRIDKIMEIIELNQYSYGYQIKEEILGGKE